MARTHALLIALRQETCQQHAALERHVLLSRLLSDDLAPEAYRDLLERMWGFYAPMEQRLAESPIAEEEAFAFARRRKAHLLVRDLEALGRAGEAAGLPVCARLPVVPTLSRALGCLYVLEGATLGGAFIARQLARSLGLGPGNGGAFYHGYGQQTGLMWNGFRRALAACAETGSIDQTPLVQAAAETFAALDHWLSQGASASGAAVSASMA